MMTPAEVVQYKMLSAIDQDDLTPEQETILKRLALQRHGGKTTNYAATYGAGGEAIGRAAGVGTAKGDMLHHAYWARNWAIKAIAEDCTVKTSRGMKWLWNPIAKLWVYLRKEKDRFSTLNQSTGTYAFDRWVFHIMGRRPKLTGQFHDEVIVDLPLNKREKFTAILKESMDKVNEELKLKVKLDCDVGYGRTYSAIH
jgi:hypothetical protein